MAKELYIFSGLGADERVFHRLDFTGFAPNFIKWNIPHKNENIQDYASRLISQIKSENPVLIGLSFGGMMAIEIAKQIKTEKVILIASAKTRSEIPFYFRLAGRMGIHKLVPVQAYKRPHILAPWIFGSNSIDENQLLKQILLDTDPLFLKWAIHQVVTWRNQTILENIFHIHGSHDKLLPLRYVKSNIIIPEGGHLITLNKFEDINRILKEEI
ncbi:MAG TPA: alpha/beta hydrolase [Bacteroidia bacterium]|nr:alpha/beta hydrolase [Bacteroidia bacterium]